MSREDLVRALERAWAGGATFAVLQRALTEATGLAAYANEHFVLMTSGSVIPVLPTKPTESEAA